MDKERGATSGIAIIAGLVTGDAARDLIRRTLEDDTLVRTKFHYRYYLPEAINKAGEGDRYLDLLGDWQQQMLERGLTTWTEFRARQVETAAMRSF